jgi:AsmA protein
MKIEKDYFSATLRMKGLKNPWISANIRSEMDLMKWDRAFGFAPADLKGRLHLQARAEGVYATRVEKKATLRRTTVDTVITSIPHFSLNTSLRNGYFKLASRPEAANNINFDIDAACTGSDYKKTRLAVDNLNAKVLDSYIKGFFRLDNLGDGTVEAGLETIFHLADIRKVYPLDSMDLAGDLAVHIKTKGSYQPDKHRFPVIQADLSLDNGSIQTKYYPHPLEKMHAGARITSRSTDEDKLEETQDAEPAAQ